MSLQRLYGLDRSSTQFSDQLNELLHDKGYINELRGLPEIELAQLVDHLNDILIYLDHAGGTSRKCLQVLREICGFRKVLPTACGLPGELFPTRQLPDAFGGFCDVYEGTLTSTVRVCIKRLRVSVKGDREKVKELFCKEAVVWKCLDHPNVVPFRGVTFEPLQLVSEWMPGGQLREYIRENRDADLISLSLGIAEGLIYLHSREVIHGDLKGPNIIVDGSGNPRIADFGLATIARDSNSLVSTSDDPSYTLRWAAPEILGSGKAASKASDIFSFGMVMIEVFTGKVPFEGVKGPVAVMYIMTGIRPERPNHPDCTEPLWTLTQRCWSKEPQDRPEMWEVIEVLEDSSTPTPPQKGGREAREKRFKREEKQKEPEGETKEKRAEHRQKETRGLKETLETPRDSRPLQEAITLAPSQKEKRQKEPEREKEGNQTGAREVKEKFGQRELKHETKPRGVEHQKQDTEAKDLREVLEEETRRKGLEPAEEPRELKEKLEIKRRGTGLNHEEKGGRGAGGRKEQLGRRDEPEHENERGVERQRRGKGTEGTGAYLPPKSTEQRTSSVPRKKRRFFCC